MGNSKTYLRVLSFFGVLILSGALMLGLFQEARAADANWTSVDESPTGTTDYTFQLEIPDGQFVPIENIGAAIEKDNPNFNGKRGATTTTVAECDMSPLGGMDCTPDGSGADELRVDGETGVVTRIQMDRIFEKNADRDLEGGYDIECDGSDGPCVFSTSGYGYDGALSHLEGDGYTSPEFESTGIGYGYGYEMDRAEATISGSGYTGYGYNQGGSGTLVIQFTVTIDASQLEEGTQYWISGLIDTGTDFIGTFTTLDQSFTPSASSTPGGAGGGGAADTPRLDVDVGESFDVSANQKVRVTSGLGANMNTLQVTFDQDCDDCTLEFTSHGGSPTSGTGPASDRGFRAWEYFNLEVHDSDGNVVEDAISDGWLTWEASASDVGDEGPSATGLLHFLSSQWTFETTELTSSETADPLEFNSTLSGFSEFAFAADTEAPSVSNTQPTGSITQVTPQISADYSDNRAIDTDSFELLLDGTEQTSDDGSLTVNADGFTFVPGTGLSQGEHTVTLTISDESGLATTETWTFRVTDPACAPAPTIADVEPADGATDVALDATITVTISEGECALDTGTITVNGEEVASTLSDGTLTAELPDSVGGMETVDVTAQVTDTGSNIAERSWTFETGQEDTGEPPTDPEDDDNTLVWIIVGLIVLAVIGVGAYFYMEEQ